MTVAYADPPYPGQARKHYAKEAAARGAVAKEVNHRLLIAHLSDEFPDGWALSTSAPALQDVLALCPAGVRVAAWVKPFAAFKVGVNPGYTWEPVIFHTTRKRDRSEDTIKDHLIEPITMRKGFPGAKPDRFWFWLFDLLGARPGDTFADLFPGSGGGDRMWARWCANQTPDSFQLEAA